MRGVQLGTLIANVRSEIGHSANANLGKAYTEVIRRRLQSVQERLYVGYDWPFLKAYGDKTLSIGSRYYDFPTTVAPEQLKKVEYKYGGVWNPLPYGIDMDDYQAVDPELNVRQDPIRKWDFYNNAGAVQWEAWPLPASSGITVRFIGKAPVKTFVADTDVCTLDSELLILFAAARILKRQEDPEADEVAGEATKHLRELLGHLQPDSGTYSFRMRGGSSTRREEPPLVAVVPASS